MYNIHAFLFLVFMMLWTSVYAQNQHQNPNIILILADDLGYGDVGAAGSDLFPTLLDLAGVDMLDIDGLCLESPVPWIYSLLFSGLTDRKKHCF